MILRATKRTAAGLLALAGLSVVIVAPWASSAATPPPADVKDTAIARKDEDGKGLSRLRGKLSERIDFDGFEPNTTLKDAVDHLAGKFDVTFIIDSTAFAAIEVQNVEEQNVVLPKMKGVRLSTLLRLLLKQIKGNTHYGSYLLRPEGIEVTTSFVVVNEALGAEALTQEATDEEHTTVNASADRVICVDVQRVPLRTALRKLADEGYNIVVDARVKELGDTPVSATLDNVLLDTALRILTQQAELEVVAVNNVSFVTTPERAAKLAAEQKKRRYKADPVPAGPPPAM